jgi:hypothetical protein
MVQLNSQAIFLNVWKPLIRLLHIIPVYLEMETKDLKSEQKDISEHSGPQLLNSFFK